MYIEGGETKGTNVCQNQYHGEEGQKWYLKSCGDGYYNIISKLNGLYLDVTGGNGKDGTNIEVWEENGAKAQKFQLLKVLETTGEKTLEEGIYQIYAKVGENRLLEVPNSETKNQAEIKIGTNQNIASQKFQVTYQKDGTYTIIALHTQKALEVKDGSGRNRSVVQQNTRQGQASQKWRILKNEDNTYSLIATCNGLALDVEGGSATIGTKVQTYKYHGKNSQKFTFEACKTEVGSQTAEEGTYRILSKENNQKVWQIENTSTANGAKLQLGDPTKSIQQKFELTYGGEGYYKIKAKNSNKVLTVESKTPKVGSAIKQQEDKDLDTQKWILKKYAEGLYGIVSKCENLYIMVVNGQDLQLARETDLKAQQFVLVNETPKKGITQIQDGVYQITTKGNKAIDVTGGSHNNGANVLIWDNTAVQQQKYQITRIGDTQYYKIIAAHSAKSLDVEGGRINPGANIIQYDDAGTNNQQWLFKDCGDGYYNIISKESGLCLDVTAGKIQTAGVNVELWYDNGADAQKFKLTPIPIIANQTYEIETKLDTNKVVDISAASQSEGANAVLWDAGNVNHERFIFQALSSDTYKIIAKHSNKALTVDTTSNNVYQATYTGASNQQWQIKVVENGYFNLICKANGLALDVYASSAKNGQNIQVYSPHGGNGQKFRLVTGIRSFYQEGTYGRSGLAIAGDRRGSSLKYYKYGRGSKVLFAAFSIHGFEDSYQHDGTELTYIAEEFKKYLDSHIDENIINNWTIYILPNLNPDGQTYGYTNNGPGRTSLFSAAPRNQGIDMNRNWSVGYKRETSARNYNGTGAFQAYEARQLRDFMLGRQGSTLTITVDTHGWLNETIGDNRLGIYYRNQFGLPSHISSYGSGYLINWARTLKNGRSVLVELPEVRNHSQVVGRNYAQKYINATMQMLREN